MKTQPILWKILATAAVVAVLAGCSVLAPTPAPTQKSAANFKPNRNAGSPNIRSQPDFDRSAEHANRGNQHRRPNQHSCSDQHPCAHQHPCLNQYTLATDGPPNQHLHPLDVNARSFSDPRGLLMQHYQLISGFDR